MRNLPPSLFVRTGEKISASTWNTLISFLRGMQLVPGRGTRIDSRPGGTTITFDTAAHTWQHNFRCVLVSPTDATIRFGAVNGKVPVITPAAGGPGVPLDEFTTNLFTWQTLRLDADARGWIAIEAQLAEDWSVASATIVQVADLDTDTGDAPPPPADGSPARPPGFSAGGTRTLSGRRARWPLAMLRRRPSGSLVLFQITHFSLIHRVNVPTNLDGTPGTTGRHFFRAA